MSDLRFIESMIRNIFNAVPIVESETSQLSLPSQSLKLASLEELSSQKSGSSQKSIESYQSYESGRVPSELLALDSEYVKKHFGIPLTLALAEILTRRPSDPIHYLGHWLLKWRWNQEQKQRHEDKVLSLIADRVRIAEDILEQERIKEEKRLIAAMELRAEAELIAQDQVNLLINSLELRDLPEPVVVEPEMDAVDGELLIEDDPDGLGDAETNASPADTIAESEVTQDTQPTVEETPN